jgi:hypothetical protein
VVQLADLSCSLKSCSRNWSFVKTILGGAATATDVSHIVLCKGPAEKWDQAPGPASIEAD